jgi:hypothetical protein
VFNMMATRRLTLAATVLGLLAAAGPAKAGPIVPFDSPGDVVLSPTPAPWTWYPDRYAPSGFASGETGGGRTGVLTESISSNDGAADRPATYAGVFYNTQGRTFDLPAGTTSMSIELYVDPTWQNLNQTVPGVSTGRLASFWGVGYDSSNNPVSYPIIEFNNNTAGSNTGGFRVWNDVTSVWENVAGFTGYGQWYTLGMALSGGVVSYTIDGSLVGADPYVSTATLGDVILQGYNAANSYDISWDNLSSSATAAAVPEPATLIQAGTALVLCAGFVWTRRRAAARVTA